MQCRAARRRPGIALMTIIFPLRMPKAYAAGILNRFAPRGYCTKAVRQLLFAFSRCKLAFCTKELSLFRQFAVFAGQTVELCGRIWYTTLYLYAPGKGAAKGERTCYEDHSGGRRQGRYGSGTPAQRGRPQRDCGGHQQSARGAPDRKLRRAGHRGQWLVHHHPVRGGH